MKILLHIALCFPQNNSLKSWLCHWFMERVGLDSIDEDERTCPRGVMMSRAHKAHCSQHSLNSLLIYTLARKTPVTMSGVLRQLLLSTTTLGQFQSGLKTILFRLAYGTRVGAFVRPLD